ncbi:hypothetical protein LQK89_02820 [Curtobacterium sp. C1]|uniref:hypothetical protein n=1 Tax=Curtobacterium sp. C1 TaxID=2898151 RepID=UPI001E5AE02C|nr:hypothetical protein [Curtobacterium sp. C1]UFU14651.1 hypothetical protein LQK89_02820 [Curtobacterium sp. C1]
MHDVELPERLRVLLGEGVVPPPLQLLGLPPPTSRYRPRMTPESVQANPHGTYDVDGHAVGVTPWLDQTVDGRPLDEAEWFAVTRPASAAHPAGGVAGFIRPAGSGFVAHRREDAGRGIPGTAMDSFEAAVRFLSKPE